MPQCRSSLARAMMLAALMNLAVPAGSASAQETTVSAPLSAVEQSILDDNPAIAQLASDPTLLRAVLDRIAAAISNPANTRGGLEQVDADTLRLFGQNPVLLQVWRSSPEASADLLALIRTAAGTDKPKK